MKSITDTLLSYIPRLRPRVNGRVSSPKRKNHIIINIATTPPKRPMHSPRPKTIPSRRLFNNNLNKTLARFSSVGTRSPHSKKSPKPVRRSPRASPKSVRRSPKKLARIPPAPLQYLTPQQINNITWGPAGINL